MTSVLYSYEQLVLGIVLTISGQDYVDPKPHICVDRVESFTAEVTPEGKEVTEGEDNIRLIGGLTAG